jgi:hypothetical protein
MTALTMLREIMLGLGFLILLFTLIKFQRKKGDVVLALIGLAYIILGAVISDPTNSFALTLGVPEIVTIIAFGSGAAFVAKALLWAVTRTDLYNKVIKALDSMTELKDDYEAIHRTTLKKSHP